VLTLKKYISKAVMKYFTTGRFLKCQITRHIPPLPETYANPATTLQPFTSMGRTHKPYLSTLFKTWTMINKERAFVVAVWPFEHYPEMSFFIAREELDSNGRTLEKYFFEAEHPQTRCTFDEAHAVVSRFQTRFPGKKCKTYSLTELRNRPV